MNKTKIEWPDWTLNPITGCLNTCPYCFARANAKRFGRPFVPMFHPERLREIRKARPGDIVFVCSMGELFAPWVQPFWTAAVLAMMTERPDVHFVALTKNPEVVRYELPPNLWLGASVDGLEPHMVQIPDPKGTAFGRNLERRTVPLIGPQAKCEALARAVPPQRRVLCIEPFMTEQPTIYRRLLGIDGLAWLIIGGRTGGGRFTPPREWVTPLIEMARDYGVPIFIKANAGYGTQITEYPKEMRG